jgi:hypothetical protein
VLNLVLKANPGQAEKVGFEFGPLRQSAVWNALLAAGDRH